MRKGIATVSVGGGLADKLDTIAAAGFDGVEIFDADLIASPLSPAAVATRCADLGLAVDLFQPVRDVEGVPPERFGQVLHRVARKLDVAVELGAPGVLVCSHAGPDAVDDPGLSAAQLHAVGELARERGIEIAFEALAWGSHVNRVAQAWEIVQRADHPAVALAVDTFHMLARGDGAEALRDVDRIAFLQVADGPHLDMSLLEWSRHHRCFPGQGTLDVVPVVAAVLERGYDGPVSLEVFSDTVRVADPGETAVDGLRSLLYLEDQLRLRGTDRLDLFEPPPAPDSADVAFVELAVGAHSAPAEGLLSSLGFTPAGAHRSKPVTWWRNGGAHVVVNADPDLAPSGSLDPVALGLVAEPVVDVAGRAKAMRWPEVATARGAGEARLPGMTSPSGVHVFVSAGESHPDFWQRDFAPPPSPAVGGLLGVDHVGTVVAPEHLNAEMSFYRTVFGLESGPVSEFMEPHGWMRSRVLRPARGGLRVVLNVDDHAPTGINQVAFACDDVLAVVRGAREAGLELMHVPENYYVDLEARFDLDAGLLASLRENGLLYDRIGDGELLHAYTTVTGAGFYIELLERRNGYEGFGAANTPLRLAVQQEAARSVHRR